MERYLEFKPVGIKDKNKIQSYTLKGHAQICDLAFANLFGWAEYYMTSWAVLNEALIIRFKPHNFPHYAYLLPVCGKEEQLKHALEVLKDQCKHEGYPLLLMGLAPECQRHLEELYPEKFELLNDRSSCDYIYLREKLASLSGKKLQSKRNHVNKFKKLYPDYETEIISSANFEECLALAKSWLKASEEDKGEDKEFQMIERMLRHFEALGLKGLALRVAGKLVAFTIGSPINATTYCIHIEKALNNYEGAFTMINKCFAQLIPEQYTFINREEDLGLAGLRKSKLSYKPHHLLDKGIAQLKDMN